MVGREIYAIGSLREIYLQETAIMEAEYAGAAHPYEIKLVGPEQVLGGGCCGEVVSALIRRNVKDPSSPFPAKFSSPVVVPGCCRLIALAPEVPEYAIFTG